MTSRQIPAHLRNEWPRQSIVDQISIFRYQPLRLCYQLYFISTFPLRLFLYIIPKTLYQRYIDSYAPPTYRYIEFFGIEIARTLIDKFWLPTGGGERGRHIKASSLKSLQLKYLKSTKALVDIIRPKIEIDDLRQPIRSWAKEALVDKVDELTVWWFGRRSEEKHQSKAKNDEKILLYFSGGGYLIGTCYPGHDFGSISSTLLDEIKIQSQNNYDSMKNLPQSIIAVEYRRTEICSMPGAFIDALSTYRYLVDDLDFKPGNISLCGDSAGGHLVNFLIRYLVEGGEETPGKIVLIAPWGDQAGTTIEHNDSSFKRNLPYDILSDNFYHYCKDMFARNLPNANKEALLDVYFSPTAVLGMIHTRDSMGNNILITEETEGNIFKNWPCTLILCGEYEVLKDQSIDMLRRLNLSKKAEDKLSKREVEFFTMKTNHDPFVAPPFLFTKQRKEAMQRIVAWLAM